MSRHYEKSKPLSDTLLVAGRILFGCLAVVFFLLCALSITSQVLRPDDDSWFFLAISAIPLLVLGLICLTAYRSAVRGSLSFYWLAAGAVSFALAACGFIGWLFIGFTPG
ncbi:hypothetical protein ASD14_04505 [Lysobacter sp. Root494]|nr:hypothetical protein ASD14_04505 [Lysobacter sp. Root494]